MSRLFSAVYLFVVVPLLVPVLMVMLAVLAVARPWLIELHLQNVNHAFEADVRNHWKNLWN